MNPKLFFAAIVAAVVLIGGYVYLTHVDRSNPVSVGNAFTKALKTGDTSSASGYFVPDKAQAWRTAADDNIRKMRSGTLERFYENIPSKPGFTSANGAGAGTVTLKAAEGNFTLDLSQVNGRWYVSKGPI